MEQSGSDPSLPWSCLCLRSLSCFVEEAAPVHSRHPTTFLLAVSPVLAPSRETPLLVNKHSEFRMSTLTAGDVVEPVESNPCTVSFSLSLTFRFLFLMCSHSWQLSLLQAHICLVIQCSDCPIVDGNILHWVTGTEKQVEETPSSSVLFISLGACASALLVTLCIVCHRKRQRRRRPAINHERRPFAPPLPFDASSRPSMSLPSDIPSPPPPASHYTSLPPLTIDVGDNV